MTAGIEKCIFGTRPWKVYGEGPATKVVIPRPGQEFDPSEDKKPDLGVRDVRYSVKGKTLYAMVQGWPASGSSEVILEALGSNSPNSPPKRWTFACSTVTKLSNSNKTRSAYA